MTWIAPNHQQLGHMLQGLSQDESEDPILPLWPFDLYKVYFRHYIYLWLSRIMQTRYDVKGWTTLSPILRGTTPTIRGLSHHAAMITGLSCHRLWGCQSQRLSLPSRLIVHLGRPHKKPHPKCQNAILKPREKIVFGGSEGFFSIL